MDMHQVHHKGLTLCPATVANYYYTRKGVIAFDRQAKTFGFVAKNSGETIFIISRPDLGQCLGLAKAEGSPIRLLSAMEMDWVISWRNTKIKTQSKSQQPQTSSEVNRLWQERSGLSGAKLAANTRKLRKLAAEGHQVPAGI